MSPEYFSALCVYSHFLDINYLSNMPHYSLYSHFYAALSLLNLLWGLISACSIEVSVLICISFHLKLYHIFSFVRLF